MAGGDRMAIEEVVRKVLVDEHADVLRESVEWLARQLMEVEVCELIRAERGERSEDRATHLQLLPPPAQPWNQPPLASRPVLAC
jgi:putative transposase